MNTTTNIKNRVIDYLQMTSIDYDENLLKTYMSWCDKYADSPSKFQQLLANARINKWFLMEYSKMQNNFLASVPHLPKTTHSLNYHYNGFVLQIFTIYPKSIIDELKTNDTFIQMINKEKVYAN
jgi:hypothetical protein